MLCKGEIGDKSARRAAVAERYRILQVVGDNLADFAPGTEPRKAVAPHTDSPPMCAQVERDRERAGHGDGELVGRTLDPAAEPGLRQLRGRAARRAAKDQPLQGVLRLQR